MMSKPRVPRFLFSLGLFLFASSLRAQTNDPSIRSVQEPSADSPGMDSSAALQFQDPTTQPLPTALSPALLDSPFIFIQRDASTGRTRVHPYRGFYRTAWNRPLTPHEVALRTTVYDLGENHNHFIHVRLKDGKVLTGIIESTSPQWFIVKTGIIFGEQTIRYRDLAEPPRRVPAVGTRVVHGLEWTGVVAGCVAMIPVAIVVYPLVLAGVIQD